jgi:hypothetical protein
MFNREESADEAVLEERLAFVVLRDGTAEIRSFLGVELFELPTFEEEFTRSLIRAVASVSPKKAVRNVVSELMVSCSESCEIAKVQFLGSNTLEVGSVVAVEVRPVGLVEIGPVVSLPEYIRSHGGRQRWNAKQLTDYVFEALELVPESDFARAFRWKPDGLAATLTLRKSDVVFESFTVHGGIEFNRTGSYIVLPTPCNRGDFLFSLREVIEGWHRSERPVFEHFRDRAKRLGFTGEKQMANKTDTVQLFLGLRREFVEVAYFGSEWRKTVAIDKSDPDSLVAAVLEMIGASQGARVSKALLLFKDE